MISSARSSGKKIVIIGGGFAGINLAQKLSRHKNFQITLVDRNNYNFFPPLLYQVATSFLEVSNISYPFRKLFRKHKNVHFRLGEFLRVDVETRTAYLDNGQLHYDYIVFATGAKANYFGNENLQRNSLPMKNIDDALRLRNALLETMEKASIATDPEERRKLLTIVVAGGGPTGVEVSGMLAEFRKNILLKDYPELGNASGAIYLVDSGHALLAQMSERSQAETFKDLTKKGVKIKLNTQVKDYVNDTVELSTGQIISAKNLIWTAGVAAGTFEGIPKTSLGRGNRMLTDDHNKVQGIEGVYAIGDTSIQTQDHRFPNGHPQLAQVAIQQGQQLSKNLIALDNNKAQKPFHYIDKGTLAIMGRNRAVGDLFAGKFHVGGYLALFIWLFIHLMGLISYPNRIKTLWNWIVAYITKDQSLRMMVRPVPGVTTANPKSAETITAQQ